jgi:hypothetical protein
MKTTFRLRPEIWRKLRALAEARALREGGRPSANAVVEDLVERARPTTFRAATVRKRKGRG